MKIFFIIVKAQFFLFQDYAKGIPSEKPNYIVDPSTPTKR